MTPIEFDTSGFDRLERKIKDLEESRKVTLDKLFPQRFMAKY